MTAVPKEVSLGFTRCTLIMGSRIQPTFQYFFWSVHVPDGLQEVTLEGFACKIATTRVAGSRPKNDSEPASLYESYYTTCRLLIAASPSKKILPTMERTAHLAGCMFDTPAQADRQNLKAPREARGTGETFSDILFAPLGPCDCGGSRCSLFRDWRTFRLFECISVMKKGSPRRYYAETSDEALAQKAHTGEPNEHHSLYRIRRTQETHQLLRQDF